MTKITVAFLVILAMSYGFDMSPDITATEVVHRQTVAAWWMGIACMLPVVVLTAIYFSAQRVDRIECEDDWEKPYYDEDDVEKFKEYEKGGKWK